MAAQNEIDAALKQVRDQRSFFSTLLGEALGWPTRDITRIEDIAYDWSIEDLNAAHLDKALVDGAVWQIQPAESGQPWGIFILQFRRPDLLAPHQGMAGVLRSVLRGLVHSRRKDASLPSWRRDHLLFICTHDWQAYRFAYFRSQPDNLRASRMTTFGWAPGTSNRTVCEYNLPSLVWPDDTSNAEKWVAAWSEAFDKEPLTKDFFRRFDQGIEAIKGDLERFQALASAEAYTQAQLLLERLIFLYFLQNRGWMDQNRRYLLERLTEHLSNPDRFTYYADFVDKLFWTLSSAPGEGGRLPGVPFLNGGLFDDDEFRQPGSNRRTNPPLKVRNVTFQKIFSELLEAFNFTVTEDTPLNEEVAVDPEMLGKVFESIVLHAEAADPDAIAPDKRKATGSYYTPRIVVHFICREVLYQYLSGRLVGDAWTNRLRALLEMDASDGLDEDVRERLRRTITAAEARQLADLVAPLKCCDPAVGSGAFPVGLLHELLNLRRLLTTAANGFIDPVRGQGSTWLHDTKADIVQNCLFGVDIQQQAIEICRLRLWLSLVVDYDLGLDPFAADRRQFGAAIDRISQLPNLEMNFHRGDSLHDNISGVPIIILPGRASRYSAELRGIGKLGQELHKAKKAERKRNLRLAILEGRLTLSGRMISDEVRSLRTQDSALDNLFGLEETASKKRERLTREIQQLERALQKIESDRQKVIKLKTRIYDSQFYHKLRQLEGADFDSPFNFAWTVDFPTIFGMERSLGFDIIVGNPPFVTARNAARRELYRQRWPLVCYKNYLLVCPFFELSFGLLKPDGQLGFIVSNAFAKRDFGKPLVERYLPKVDIQKVIDCSGLLFPGHGTPTCLVFGRRPGDVVGVSGSGENGGNNRNWTTRPIRVAAILPGGGDLRTPPEQSPLWETLSKKHDVAGFSNRQVVVSDRSRSEMAKWPWNFVPDDVAPEVEPLNRRLRDLCAEPVGAQFITGKDEAFVQPAHYFRRLRIPISLIRPYGTGEDVRNWSVRSSEWIVFPYDEKLRPLGQPLHPALSRHLLPLKEVLENCVISGSIKKKETKLKWFEFRRLARAKFESPLNIIVPQISTHAHFVAADHSIAFKEKAQAIALKSNVQPLDCSALLGLLNSSLMLERLKQDCFNKGAGKEEEKDRYEFSGGKIEEILIPGFIASALGGEPVGGVCQLARMAQRCSGLGQKSRSVELRRLFEAPGEAYSDWNCRLPSCARESNFGPPFEGSEELRATYAQFRSEHSMIRSEMIALQEEMDWLVYGCCGLLPIDHPSGRVDIAPAPLDRDLRPFRLAARASELSVQPEELVPRDWQSTRRDLWIARLAVLRDVERVRQIEQPVYKRRWDEQWKIGAQWQSGRVAYAAEFIEAFEWWIREKAEWWIEHKAKGAPVNMNNWITAVWSDTRVQSAWTVAAEEYALLAREKSEKGAVQGLDLVGSEEPMADSGAFGKAFKRIIDEETVPEGIPWGLPYETVEAKGKNMVPAKVKALRGKLNVPRERFHLHKQGTYSWAGEQI